MKLPYLPSDAAIRVARDQVIWSQLFDHALTGPGMLLASCSIPWPHGHEPSWGDVVLILAAWWDENRGDQAYWHDGRVIPLSARAEAGRPRAAA